VSRDASNRRVISVIIARKGSRGVPGKNMREVGGRPLLEYMLETASEAAREVDMDIVLSTDSTEMQDLALRKCIQAPFIRPDELSKDDIPSLPVVKHAVEYMETTKDLRYGYIAYLQPTCPLCRPSTIVEALKTIMHDKTYDSAVAVTEVETHPFRMKRVIGKNTLINYIDQGFEDMRPRQILPKVYRRAGSVYASKRNIVMEQNTLVGANTAAIVVGAEEAIDVDSELDLKLVDFLLRQHGKQD